MRTTLHLARTLAFAALAGLAQAGPTAGDTPEDPSGVFAADVQHALKEIPELAGRLIERKGIDWADVSLRYTARAQATETVEQHLELLRDLLAELRDGHAIVQKMEAAGEVDGPSDPRGGRAGLGLFLCRSGGAIRVKTAWAGAARAGLAPGCEVLAVDGTPIDAWLGDRIARMRSAFGFSTDHQAFHWTCHYGLAGAEGDGLQVRWKDAGGAEQEARLEYGTASIEPQGPAFFPASVEVHKNITYGVTENGFGYIYTRRCYQDVAQQVDVALEALGDVPGMILDLRANSGGAYQQEQLMGRFIPKGKSISFDKRYVSRGPRPYGGPVVVIVDGLVTAAGETTAAMFKDDGRAYLIGEDTTAGMCSRTSSVQLPSGMFSLRVSTRSDMQRANDGRGIEGIGVAPHETVPYEPADLAAGIDSLVRRAEEVLVDYYQEEVPYDPWELGWGR